VIVGQDPARGQDHAVLESHRNFIDIQYTISGHERIGWEAASECEAESPYDAGRDLQFYDNRPRLWVDVPADHFAVFFPTDAHAPLAGDQSPRKAVVKVAVKW
jgi:biofilm protein TabA